MNVADMDNITSLRAPPMQMLNPLSEQIQSSSTKRGRSFFGFTTSNGRSDSSREMGILVDHSSFDSDTNPIRHSDHFLEKMQSEYRSINKKVEKDTKVISIMNSCTRNGKGATSAKFVASDASSCDMSCDDDSTTSGINVKRARKNRRKMRWRVGKKQSSRKPVRQIQKGESTKAFESMASKTVNSFRTFHSTATQKADNKKLQEESKTTARIDNVERTLKMMNDRKKYTTIDNSFESTEGHTRDIAAKDVDKQMESGERNTLPRGADSTPCTVRRKKSVSPSGTDLTVDLSFENRDIINNISDDDILMESIIAMEPDEDLEGHRTIGIFLDERKEMHLDSSAPTSTKEKQHNSGNLLRCEHRDSSQSSTNGGIFSHRHRNNLSADYELIQDVLDKSSINNIKPTSGTPLGRGAVSNIDDDSEDGSEGPLWKLAQLHAISEGHIPPPPSNLETKSSSSSINSQERTRFRMFQAERNQRAMHELGKRHLGYNEYDEAIEVFEEILRGQIELHGENDHRVGTALHNIATVYMRARAFTKTIQICQKAIIVRCRMLGPSHPDLAVSFSQLGIAYLEIDEHRPALRAFRAALGIRRKSLDRADPKIARLLNNIGCSLFELGQLIDAKVAFEEALAIQRCIMRHNSPRCFDKGSKPNNVNHVLLTIAATLCNLGSIQLRWKMHEKAIVVLEEALLIQESVLGDEHFTVLSTKGSIRYLERKRQSEWSNSLHLGVKALAEKMEITNRVYQMLQHAVYRGI